jgi:hypothetical protein
MMIVVAEGAKPQGGEIGISFGVRQVNSSRKTQNPNLLPSPMDPCLSCFTRTPTCREPTWQRC